VSLVKAEGEYLMRERLSAQKDIFRKISSTEEEETDVPHSICRAAGKELGTEA
jgi:hypothetical protein